MAKQRASAEQILDKIARATPARKNLADLEAKVEACEETLSDKK